MKAKRHAAILTLIKENDIDTQEELLRLLRLKGFNVTQATVSRDINELNLVKTVTADGGYRYQPNSNIALQTLKNKYASILSDCVVSADWAGNTAVVKCHVGMAQAACAAIDSMGFDSIVGTLAGDDTIFVLFKTENKALDFTSRISEFYSK